MNPPMNSPMKTPKAPMKYRTGQLVMNPKLGLGKVVDVRGSIVTVFFKDHPQAPRRINVTVVPMTVAPNQSDPALDDPKLLKKTWTTQLGRKNAVRQPKRPAI